MLRLATWVFAGWLVLLSSVNVQAQETTKKYFYTRQECEPVDTVMLNLVQKYGEMALFTGQGIQFDYEGTPFTGGVMFMVNQDTGTWTLITLYGDGTACVTAVGNEFGPFSG